MFWLKILTRRSELLDLRNSNHVILSVRLSAFRTRCIKEVRLLNLFSLCPNALIELFAPAWDLFVRTLEYFRDEITGHSHHVILGYFFVHREQMLCRPCGLISAHHDEV